ncbi:hypothetical protein GWI33_011686 [Rhynchophorus ferrugineus]|uniref:Uncharacterized protein n=1 Tax=Rhynchophorus ferrugineus TaxID=354439 RepID=A0A834ICH6_RHYFE|nr:hypothetical protein GWI33_012395 [Rhynchophorus ferrugineus]KAF7275470.1 hypothetical protein GWI33_011686 [Rhynchophorus ferrugineus]
MPPDKRYSPKAKQQDKKEARPSAYRESMRGKIHPTERTTWMARQFSGLSVTGFCFEDHTAPRRDCERVAGILRSSWRLPIWKFGSLSLSFRVFTVQLDRNGCVN